MIDLTLVILLTIVFIAGALLGSQITRKRVLKRSFRQRLDIPEPDVGLSTWEQHQAYGESLRKQGRYDEAVAWHQSLLANDEWVDYHQAVQFELAEDFYFSGLYDRAERIYYLTLQTKAYHNKSLLRLSTIAARLRDWQRLSELLAGESSLSGELAKLYVHSQCEIALRHREHGLHELAEGILAQLKATYPEHPRVVVLTLRGGADTPVGEYLPRHKILEFSPTVSRFQQLITSAAQAGLATSQLQREMQAAGWLERRYQCSYCGFTTNKHHWQCPQCEHWETLQDQR